MATGVASWVKTPASANATADQNVNAAEGMAPAQVNDGMRAMMSSVAMWRDDLTGIVTTGSATAYAVTSSQGFASLAALNGRRIAIIPHVSSGATPTLSVDGLAPRPIRLQTGTAPSSAAFVQGSPSELLYNDTNGEFLAYGSAAGIPTGAIMPYAGSAAPDGWHLCCGQTVSATTYAALAAVVGAAFNIGGEPGGTFRLPDLRGRVPAGLDNVGGFGYSARIQQINSTILGANGGLENHLLTFGELPAHGHDIVEPNSGQGHQHWLLSNHHNTSLLDTDSGGGPFSYAAPGSGAFNQVATGGLTQLQPSGVAVSGTGTNSGPGGGTHTILQPTLILNYIIKF